ncbi:hypothetical protein [Roseateles sp.]|uniref:hypothetical protein n=1 Tax=Roseateles sp. TaxID=1971397 RepID=UPI0039EAA4B0
MDIKLAMSLLLPFLAACSTTPQVDRVANCVSAPPAYTPVATTFEENCRPGQIIVDRPVGKSPVVKFNFPHPQEVTITAESGATSSGGNGRGAQVCLWQSWAPAKPCGTSDMSSDNFNAWNGAAACAIKVPAGLQYVRALQVNQNADESNTSIYIRCR